MSPLRLLPGLLVAGWVMLPQAAQAQPNVSNPAPPSAPAAPEASPPSAPPATGNSPTRVTPPGPVIQSPPSPANPDGPPRGYTLALEGALGMAARLNDSPTGFKIDERLAVNYHAGVYLGFGTRFDLGVHYLHTGIGYEVESSVATTTSGEINRTLDAVMLDARFVPWRNDWARLFLGVTAGLGWQGVDRSGTIVAQPESQPLLTKEHCSAHGSASFGFGGSLGADFDLGDNVMFLVRTAVTNHRLSDDYVSDNDNGPCARGSGSTSLFQAQIGFQYRFDLGGQPKKM